MKENITDYQAPAFEILDVRTEAGFQFSTKDSTIDNYGTEDATGTYWG